MDNAERERVLTLARQAASISRNIRVIHAKLEVSDDYSRNMFRIAGSLLDFASSTLTEWHQCTRPDWETTANGILREWGIDEL